MQVIQNLDYYLLPIYLVIVFFIIGKFRKGLEVDKNSYKIYYTGFSLKILGALTFALIAQYYYGYGDSLTYFDEARMFHEHIMKDISNIKYFFCTVEEYKKFSDLGYNATALYVVESSGLFVIKITTLLTFVSGNTYLTTTLFFVILSFSGMWVIFKTFSKLYPSLKNQFAWGILYLPSVIFWSSGIMKDSLSIAALGWLFYSFYEFFIFKNKKYSYLIIILVCGYSLYIVKYYIITAFLLTFIMVGLFYIVFKLRPLYVRVIITLIFIVAGIAISRTNFISDLSTKFTFESIANQIGGIQTLFNKNNSVGEGNFDMGTITPTFAGLVEKIPFALSTFLYRPFLWETKNVLMLFSGLENFILLLLSIIIIFRSGVINFFKAIAFSELILFCLFFTIIFGIIVGFTTFNFGTLLRYKAPCMPFYTSLLILINYKARFIKNTRKKEELVYSKLNY